MAKPIMNQIQWCAFEGKLILWVDVAGCRVRIMHRLNNGSVEDITDKIPDGKKMAVEAMEAFGGAANVSEVYPPTYEIIGAIRALIAKSTL